MARPNESTAADVLLLVGLALCSAAGARRHTARAFRRQGQHWVRVGRVGELQMIWIQHELHLPPRRRGLHLITAEVIAAVPELSDVQIGLLNLLLQHTSASLTLNENADPDVQTDLEAWLNRVAPEQDRYVHSLEGPDDMPAHIKSTVTGNSLTLPVRDGRLALGTWQGIYLCEHRTRANARRCLLTLHGQRA